MSDEVQGWRTRLDREAQRRILARLAEDYPQDVAAEFLYEHIEPNLLLPNISYLEEHGLITAEYFGPKWQGNPVLTATLTHRGYDFIQDDGGLGAILGVLTVRIHEDFIKDLIASKVMASDLSEPDKQKFVDQLRELPGETTKHLMLRLVDAGLENWHRVLPLLQNILA
ncbi:hypothetical protein I5V52_08705 [Stenotrophomonas maltophilia]|uniref:hypothetical protein n=1 Tax=Stenotrophomonas maltophilia TaxID=40324 RepID=UPI000C153CE7|nr:hypothetical protein [Stenotrophomonas maltophilia]MBH1563916.1 hypothetical protein [Stenotrophomonas maltophilia]MBH1643725.1 hypothetical protein [Stenotrophomonas maltophilia]MBH1758898.1 hypothetical protein [Stenotrophomonas maltophilia]MBH1762846.1 hypothetical protein [Stenotrophomonas maltophilia]MBH1771943.1 hypothetical protein [Stenotrophomonas maltophilia]